MNKLSVIALALVSASSIASETVGSESHHRSHIGSTVGISHQISYLDATTIGGAVALGDNFAITAATTNVTDGWDEVRGNEIGFKFANEGFFAQYSHVMEQVGLKANGFNIGYEFAMDGGLGDDSTLSVEFLRLAIKDEWIGGTYAQNFIQLSDTTSWDSSNVYLQSQLNYGFESDYFHSVFNVGAAVGNKFDNGVDISLAGAMNFSNGMSDGTLTLGLSYWF